MPISNPAHWKELYGDDKGDKYDKILAMIAQINANEGFPDHASEHHTGGGDLLAHDSIPGGTSGSPHSAAIQPHKNLTTINNKPAVLLFDDDYTQYPTTYDEDVPPFWKYHAESDGSGGSIDYIKLDNSTWQSRTGMKLKIRSVSDIIRVNFEIPGNCPSGIVLELQDFYYDDIGASDRFVIFFYAFVWDASVGTVVERSVMQLLGESNAYYHYPNGVKTNTGWGNPETAGWHTLKFFMQPQSSRFDPTGNRCPYRIEMTGKTAVVGHRDDLWDDDLDRFVRWGRGYVSPTLSSGWDIEVGLERLLIYARDNNDF